MKETFEINLMSRDDTGKGASRRLRHAGLVPGIVYGGGKDPQMVSAKHNELAHHLENEAFYSHILTIKVGEKDAQKVVLKDLQRHPAKPFILHFDFLRVSDKDQIKMTVPLHFEGEDAAPGIKAGGNLIHSMTELEILCEAQNLPEYITIDISDLDVGDTMHLGQVQVPEGVEILTLVQGGDSETAVVAIQAPKVETEPEDEAEGGEEPEAETED